MNTELMCGTKASYLIKCCYDEMMGKFANMSKRGRCVTFLRKLSSQKKTKQDLVYFNILKGSTVNEVSDIISCLTEGEGVTFCPPSICLCSFPVAPSRILGGLTGFVLVAPIVCLLAVLSLLFADCVASFCPLLHSRLQLDLGVAGLQCGEHHPDLSVLNVGIH